MLSKPNSIVYIILITLTMTLGGTQGFAQSTEPVLDAESSQADSLLVEIVPPPSAPLIYAHLFGGAGFSYLSSSDVETVIGDDFGIGIGIPTWSYGIRGGYRHIFQVEYNVGKSDHDFNNNSIVEDIPNEVISMDYSTNEIQFKLNPFFWKEQKMSEGKSKAFFLVYGFGDVEWTDDSDDGFSGTSTIIGLEYFKYSKYVSGSVSFKHYGIVFDETTIGGVSSDKDINASDFILEIKVGIGFGL